MGGNWAPEAGETNCSLSFGWVSPVVISAPTPRYSTIYTMFPVFSLVLDKDVKSEVAMLYPELYKDLLKVRWTLPSLLLSFLPFLLSLSLLFFLRFCLFVTDTEKERGRDTGRGRRRLQAGSPIQDSRITP